MGLVGALLLLMALSSAYLRRLPITTSAIYLALGLLVSPIGLGLININFAEWRVWFEHLTEIAIILSLFIGGLKLRLPLHNPVWQAAYRLAAPVMLASIAGVAIFSHFVFGLDWAVAFLLGALLAPTDPVLASTVSVNDAGDHDRMRYGLSGEAGFNDGAAFPFVIFALMWAEYGELGGWVSGWALHRLVWAIPAGLLLGYFLGKGIGRLAIWLRSRHQETDAPNDFLALALIALAYVGAETIGAWGFLATFAAGVGFRRAEIKIVEENPAPEHNETEEAEEAQLTAHPPAEEFVGKKNRRRGIKTSFKSRWYGRRGNHFLRQHCRKTARSAAAAAGRHLSGNLLGLASDSAGSRVIFRDSSACRADFFAKNADRKNAAFDDGLVRHSRHRQSLLFELRS